MTVTLAARSHAQVIGTLREHLTCPSDETALQQALAADHIRSAVYANAVVTADTGISPAMHTTRLLTSVRKSLDLLWPRLFSGPKPSTSDLAQQTLDSLAQAGDLADTGGGYWLGVPLRIVHDAQEQTFLLTGGISNEGLRGVTGQVPVCAGISRFLKHPASRSSAQLRPYLQSVDLWLGPNEPLRPWAEQLLRAYEARLTSSSDVSAEHLEIYAPDLFSARHQKGRWMPASQLTRSLPDIRLCRPLASFTREWSRPYYLAQFAVKSAAAVVTRSTAVPFETTLRLRFAFDELLASPRTARIRHHADMIELDMPYALPDPESRVMALGWPSHATSGRTLFHPFVLPILVSVLQRLAIDPLAQIGS